jgi:limonene-1,2-epoxide hydrolase
MIPSACASPIDVAVEYIRAFNDRDLDAFVAVLDPEVKLHSMRGLRQGHDGARAWADRAPGGVQQSILVDAVYDGTKLDGATVVALISRRWHWEEDGSFAGEDQMAWLFELRDNLILGWRPFDRREDALSVAGLGKPPNS